MEKYELLECVGKGSQGVVFKCKRNGKKKQKKENEEDDEKKEEKILAMKRILTSDISSANKVIEELLLVKDLKHVGIVDYYDFFLDEKDGLLLVCIIMDYFEEGDLDRLIKEIYVERKCRLEEDVVRYFILEIAKTLDFMHSKNMMHRDLKPPNVFLQLCENSRMEKKNKSPYGKYQLKIGDFGLSTSSDSFKSTFCGSMSFLSPELLRGERYDSKVDLFSLGVLMYKLLTGKEKAFQIDMITNPLKVKASIEAELKEYYSLDLIKILLDLLNENPKKRLSAEQTIERLTNPVSDEDGIRNRSEHAIVKTLNFGKNCETFAVLNGILYAGLDNGKIVKYNILESKIENTCEAHISTIRAMGIFKHKTFGEVLITTGNDNKINVFEVPSLNLLSKNKPSSTPGGWNRCFVSWNNQIVTGGFRSASFYDIRKDNVVLTKKCYMHKSGILAMCRDNFYLYSGGEDGQVIVTDLLSKREKKIMRNHSGVVWDILVDEKEVVTGSADGTIKIFSKIRQDYCSFERSISIKESVLCLCMSRKWLLAGTLLGGLYLFNRFDNYKLAWKKQLGFSVSEVFFDEKRIYCSLYSKNNSLKILYYSQ